MHAAVTSLSRLAHQTGIKPPAPLPGLFRRSVKHFSAGTKRVSGRIVQPYSHFFQASARCSSRRSAQCSTRGLNRHSNQDLSQSIRLHSTSLLFRLGIPVQSSTGSRTFYAWSETQKNETEKTKTKHLEALVEDMLGQVQDNLTLANYLIKHAEKTENEDAAYDWLDCKTSTSQEIRNLEQTVAGIEHIGCIDSIVSLGITGNNVRVEVTYNQPIHSNGRKTTTVSIPRRYFKYEALNGAYNTTPNLTLSFQTFLNEQLSDALYGIRTVLEKKVTQLQIASEKKRNESENPPKDSTSDYDEKKLRALKQTTQNIADLHGVQAKQINSLLRLFPKEPSYLITSRNDFRLLLVNNKASAIHLINEEHENNVSKYESKKQYHVGFNNIESLIAFVASDSAVHFACKNESIDGYTSSNGGIVTFVVENESWISYNEFGVPYFKSTDDREKANVKVLYARSGTGIKTEKNQETTVY